MNTQFLAEGLCAQTDPEAFYPDKGGSVTEAKAVCRRCPVKAACLEHALTAPEEHGVWGGMSERERHALRRTRNLPTATDKRVAEKRAAVARLAGKGRTKKDISRALGISLTMVNRYLAETGAAAGRAA